MKMLRTLPTGTAAAIAAIWSVAAVPAAAVDDLSVAVAPGSEFVTVGDTVTFTLDVANLSAPINGVQVLLQYDNTLMTFSGVTPSTGVGVGWSNVGMTDNNGTITYAAVMLGGATDVNHTVATLTFTADAVGVTNVSFLPDNPPAMTLLTVASDNSTISPNTFDSGVVTIDAAVGGPHVAAVEVFYAGQFSDAPDPSRLPLATGVTATASNITNYIHGITGLRIVFDTTVVFATTPAAALSFAWTTGTGTAFAPVTDATTAVTVSASDVGGATVATITLVDDHVRKRWLRVTLDATQVTAGGVPLDGELSGDPMLFPSGDGTAGGNAVFHLGNQPGDVTQDRKTTLVDVFQVRAEVNPVLTVPIENVFDVNKSGKVTLVDVFVTRVDVNPVLALPLITP